MYNEKQQELEPPGRIFSVAIGLLSPAVMATIKSTCLVQADKDPTYTLTIQTAFSVSIRIYELIF